MSTDPAADPLLSSLGLEQLPLVDHHCHGVVDTDLEQPAFELLMTESDEPAPYGTSHFDTPVGRSIRRWCAPVLDLDPGVTAARYLERRAQIGAVEVNRRLLCAAGIEVLLIETGYRADDILDPAAMAARAGATAHEVVRIERVAEQVADQLVAGGGDPDTWADALATQLREDSRGAVGLKSIVAYRAGFRIDPSPPSPIEVAAATARWLARPGPARIDDPTLLRAALQIGLEVAHEHRIPIQLHVGFGDADIAMADNDPTLLRGWIERAASLEVDLMLLHCYPFHRQAGWLAAVYPNVYADVGLTLNYVGPAAARILTEASELTPTTKQLFSSDAFGLAELYYLGAERFRRGLASLLGEWLSQGECDEADAVAIATAIGSGNARRVYPLERARAW